MTTWSLSELLQRMHRTVHLGLDTARSAVGHPVLKGDAAETVWLETLSTYLPARYVARRAVVVDSLGSFSDQIDIVVFDRQYTPFVFDQSGMMIVPSESVYAILEAKQSVSASEIAYSKTKIASVRNLYRTSLPIPTANGEAKAKVPHHIIGGIVALESSWKDAMSSSLLKCLKEEDLSREIDIGCIAKHGIFWVDEDRCHSVELSDSAATLFIFELIARLQLLATVPMIDVRAYSRWLKSA